MIHIENEISAADLLAELLACPPEERPGLLTLPRFLRSDLLDLLLEECQAALPFDPGRAEELLSAAAVLGRYFEQEGATELGFELERKSLAVCLRGTARRLRGDHRGAEKILEQAAFLEVSGPSQASFCRSLSLLRWDQGRYEEAVALLFHAARRFEEQRNVREAAVCLALEGILRASQSLFGEAGEALEAALEDVDRERSPWLTCQALLSRALCHLHQGQAGLARQRRREAWAFRQNIGSEEAQVGLSWLEGRVAAGLEDLADAEALLAFSRQAFLAGGHLPEATLTTADLALVLAQQERSAESESLFAEVEGVFHDRPGLDLAVTALRSMADDLREGGALGSVVWLGVSSALRVLLPHQGVYFRPVPFA